MMHTVLSSSAIASLLWRPPHTPSSPSVSPTIWKPVTCSRPSRCMTTVLNEPVRTA
ncbi:transcriptional regulator, Crp/Fnr family domain protein [Burkholderia pseudomallei MSHR7500]|nr:transcriptional regulator, Crp/Fnr family domain protein [Burkholderia pseudomallei MSHR7504]KGS86373.1 transcriptional regulator, Crp/Fnr family domain protein [Burkholderia pseudomallei MSHR7500]